MPRSRGPDQRTSKATVIGSTGRPRARSARRAALQRRGMREGGGPPSRGPGGRGRPPRSAPLGDGPASPHLCSPWATCRLLADGPASADSGRCIPARRAGYFLSRAPVAAGPRGGRRRRRGNVVVVVATSRHASEVIVELAAAAAESRARARRWPSRAPPALGGRLRGRPPAAPRLPRRGGRTAVGARPDRHRVRARRGAGRTSPAAPASRGRRPRTGRRTSGGPPPQRAPPFVRRRRRRREAAAPA